MSFFARVSRLRSYAHFAGRSCLSLNKRTHFHRAMAPSDEFYDVVINGAGLAGIATAVSLAKSPAFANRRILIVDKADESHVAGSPSAPHIIQKTTSDDSSGDANKLKVWNSRVVALNPSSMELIYSWGDGAWDQIEAKGVGRMLDMRISDASSNAHLSFGDGFEPLAWVVETSNLLSVFGSYLDKVVTSKHVTVRRGASVVDVSSDKTGSLLNLQVDPKPTTPLWTKLLIVADGANSFLREQLYFRKINFDYNQLGIVATLKLKDFNNEGTTAWQRFLPTGPVALLPLDKSHCSLIWSADKPLAKTLMALSDEEFTATLNDALSSDYLVQKPISEVISQIRQIAPQFLKQSNSFRPPRIDKVISKRMTFPLRLMHALPVTQHRVVLMGDAAHTLHPLAGLGLNLGIGDIAELRRVLNQAADAGDDIGTTEQLAAFRFQRNCRSVPLAATTHFLHQIYSTTSAPLVALRSLGVTALDLLSPLKHAIVSQASEV